MPAASPPRCRAIVPAHSLRSCIACSPQTDMPFFTRANANEFRAMLGALRSATAEDDVDKAHGVIVSLRALTEGVPLGTVIGSCRSLDETAEWLRNVLTSEGATEERAMDERACCSAQRRAASLHL
jgi:hypothetical protein